MKNAKRGFRTKFQVHERTKVEAARTLVPGAVPRTCCAFPVPRCVALNSQPSALNHFWNPMTMKHLNFESRISHFASPPCRRSEETLLKF